MKEVLRFLHTHPNVQEIMITPEPWVFAEIAGKVQPLPQIKLMKNSLLSQLQHLLFASGKNIDLANPKVEAMIDQTIRLSAIMPPISPQGLIINLRKITTRLQNLDELGTIAFTTGPHIALLKNFLQQRKNILICGATSTGKTTLLSALLNEICLQNPLERIICIEDTQELRRAGKNCINLLAQPCTEEQKQNFRMQDLLISSLRLRPDRIVIGECRGPEVFHYMQVINSGHNGSLCTIHASSPEQGLSKLALLAILNNGQISYQQALVWIQENIDIVLYCEKTENGQRKMTDPYYVPSCRISDPPLRISGQ